MTRPLLLLPALVTLMSSELAGPSLARADDAPPPEKAAAPNAKGISRTPKKSAGALRHIDITSQRFEMSPNAQRAVWTGDVIAERDDVRVTCDKLTASFGEGRKIQTVQCEGNVHMIQRTPGSKAIRREAWGERAFFDNAKALLTVTGDPKARDGGSRMRGDKVLFFVDEDRVVVERPRMLLESAAELGGKK